MQGLKLNGVSYRYGKAARNALDGVSCEFRAGEVAAVVGPSGSGKTTLLSIMAGLDRPAHGEVYLGDRELGGMDMDEYRRRYVSVIFQAFHLFPLLTVLENVCFPMELNGVSEQEARERARLELERVGIAAEKHRRYPSQLSGGEQQRVAIARALAKNPKLMLCDEPTGALDYQTGKQVLKLLQDTCRKTGMTVIIITHNSALAPMADRVVHVKNGTVASVELNAKPMPIEEIEW